jgi:endogenous inhibitor of DNA gyrase (YacG/DUF329 family)
MYECDKQAIEKHKAKAPKYCPRCGKKATKKEKSAYVSDVGFGTCKERIYYQINCSGCGETSKIDGPTL